MAERDKYFFISPYIIAQLYAKVGETEQAFAQLEKAYEMRSGDLTQLKVDPMMDSLRTDARYDDLLRRVGLPQ